MATNLVLPNLSFPLFPSFPYSLRGRFALSCLWPSVRGGGAGIARQRSTRYEVWVLVLNDTWNVGTTSSDSMATLLPKTRSNSGWDRRGGLVVERWKTERYSTKHLLQKRWPAPPSAWLAFFVSSRFSNHRIALDGPK